MKTPIPSETRSGELPPEWAWIKKYQAWEANRKIFLHPENWLKPSLRDEKSRLFNDLEDELLQTDLTKAPPIVRAEIIALAQIGAGGHKSRDFHRLVKSILLSESKADQSSVIEIPVPTREYIHEGIRRLLDEGIK